jgi:hypothetical protein
MDELERIKNMTPEEQQEYLETLQACEHDCATCEQECGSRVNKPAKVVLVVTGGKGGTGKSVVSVLLAKAIRKLGATAAILDADIACPAIPALLGMHEPVLGDMPELAPVESADGIPVVSMGIIVEDYTDKPAGTYQDTVTFTAKVENAGIPVSSVTINNAPTEALFVNSTGTLTATVSPNDATDKTVTWSSRDPDYVSINETTGEYTIMGKKGYGSATITATAGDKTATCTITGKVHHTSLQAGDIIRVGETIYTGGSWSVNIKPVTSFGTYAGVITLVEDETNGKLYYKFSRGSNNSIPNWTSFRVTDNTDGLYIVSGTGTSSDKFVFRVHTK